MSTPDDRPTRPLPTDPDDPGTTQEDTMSTANDPGATPGADTATADAAPTPTTTSTTASTTVAPATARRGMRVGTVVWGLVLATIGAGVLAWAIGLSFDVELAVIVLVAAAGVLLLAGSVATVWRRRT